MAEDFYYHRPVYVEEALERIEGERLKPLAGGTDFLVALRGDPAYLSGYKGILDLSPLTSLRVIEPVKRGVEIGALVTHSHICSSLILRRDYPALVKASASVGSTLIRNQGTIGGNICHGAPSADTLGPLLVYRATVTLRSKHGLREVPIQDFLQRPYKTVCREDEIVTSLYLPLPPSGMKSSFIKIGRRQAQVKARMSLSYGVLLKDGRVEEMRIVPGAVTPVPTSFTRVEREICGQRVSQLQGEELGKLMAEEMAQRTETRWSTPYKRPVIANLFHEVIDQIKGEVE